MCLKAYKISKIQELPGALPPGPPPGIRQGATGGLNTVFNESKEYIIYSESLVHSKFGEFFIVRIYLV
jgi:hypothetical protein